MSFYEYGKTEEYLLSLIGEPPQPELKAIVEQAKDMGIPIICDTGAMYLKLMTKLVKPKRILEIGTAIGYSGLIMLLNSKADLYTIDFDEVALEKARRNFLEFEMEKRVRIIAGDASDVLPMVEGKFEFIFLDGPKGRYYEFLPYLIDLLPKGGVLLCDNVLYSGRMSGERAVPDKKRTIAERLEKFINAITNDKRLTTSILPIGDGMSISIKD